MGPRLTLSGLRSTDTHDQPSFSRLSTQAPAARVAGCENRRPATPQTRRDQRVFLLSTGVRLRPRTGTPMYRRRRTGRALSAGLHRILVRLGHVPRCAPRPRSNAGSRARFTGTAPRPPSPLPRWCQRLVPAHIVITTSCFSSASSTSCRVAPHEKSRRYSEEVVLPVAVRLHIKVKLDSIDGLYSLTRSVPIGVQ